MSEHTPHDQLSAAESPLSPTSLKTMEILCFFYYQIEQYESAARATQALLALAPSNKFALRMQVLVADALEDYKSVLQLTENMPKDTNQKQQISLTLLRARALQKTQRETEAQKLLKTLS